MLRKLITMTALAMIFAGCESLPMAIQPKVAASATPEAKGVDALVRLQKSSGGFGTESTENVGITALAALAMLSTQSVDSSVTDEPLRKATKFILASQQKDGLLSRDGDPGPMYGHGFATFYLTQAYTITSNPTLKEHLKTAIESAVKLIERAQNKDGGWRYQATPADADVSVTAAELRALAAAKSTGFDVNPKTLERAIAYLQQCQAPDGGFRYMNNGGGSAFARSAAATAALIYSGTPNPQGVAYLSKTDQSISEGFFYYGTYYLAQSINMVNARDAKSFADLRGKLLERQDPQTGLWVGEAGDAYATSMALIVLSIPNSKLPAFIGK